MIVCSCRRVNDAGVAEAIRSGAKDIDEIVLRCGAGSRCGGCWPTLAQLLDRMQPVAVG